MNINEVELREVLWKLIEEQSEGEWDDSTIKNDVDKFADEIIRFINRND